MKKTTIAAAICFAFSAAARGLEIPAPKKTPVKTIKTVRHSALKKKNKWVQGGVELVTVEKFSPGGKKTEHIEISKNGQERKHLKYEYLNEKETTAFCENRLSASKEKATSFMRVEKGPVMEFCKDNEGQPKNVVFTLEAAKKKDGENPAPIQIRLTVFDKKTGMPEREILVNSLNEVEEKRIYEYGENEETVSSYDAAGDYFRRETTRYNPATKTVIISVYDETETLVKKTTRGLRSDFTLRRTEIARYDEGGFVVSKRIIYCDSWGIPKKEFYYDSSSGEPAYGYVYFHEKNEKKDWTYRKREKMITLYGKSMKDPNASPDFKTRKITYYPEFGKDKR